MAEFLKYFEERGISLETVLANGIRLSPPEETYRAVGCSLSAVRWDYGDGYQRYRFLGDTEWFPRDEKGKPIKAKATRGSGNRLYMPLRAGQGETDYKVKLGDAAIPVLIVEGEADTLGVLQAEKESLVVGVSGCWGWKSKDTPILPELEGLALPGRVMILCPDSDWRHNPRVYQGWYSLGVALRKLGCSVKVKVIKSDSGDKLGAGDYIHQFGVEAWNALELVMLSEWRVKPKMEEEEKKAGTEKKSVAKELIETALEMGELWHDSSGTGWIDYRVDGILQTAKIRSKRFRDFLSRTLWERNGKPINSEGWTQAVGTLEGLARFNHPEREAFLRVGRHEDNVYIDLGSQDWRVIRVSAEGWQIIPYADCPIRFYRSDCQLALPIPQQGGSLDDLWRLLNFKEEDRPLVVGWLLSCFTPDGAKPIMALSGEKGAGKSSAATLLKRLTDPTKVNKASSVGNPREMAAMAAGRWVLSFDNLTFLSTEQQDLICCVSTGAGYSHRTLFTDLDETFLEYRRPQILTGVDLVPTRSDLLDRCLIVRLERILEENRLPETELESLTAELLPSIYGALLDLLVTALKNIRTIKPPRLPRMADFANLCIAAGIPNFSQAYTTNIEAGCQAAVEANPVAAAILPMLESNGGNWQGTASELVKKLQEGDPSNRDLQKLSADSLGRKLSKSLKTDLEAVGVSVDQIRQNKTRTWILTYTPKRTLTHGDTSNGVSDTSQNIVSPTKPSQDKGCDTCDTSDTSPTSYLAPQKPYKAKNIYSTDQDEKQASQVSLVSQARQDKGFSGDTSQDIVSLVSPEVSLMHPKVSRDVSPERHGVYGGDTSKVRSDTSSSEVSQPKPSQINTCDTCDTSDTSLRAYLAPPPHEELSGFISSADQDGKKVSQVSLVSQPSQGKASSGDTSVELVSLVSPQVSPLETKQSKGCDTNDTSDTSQEMYLSLDLEVQESTPVVSPDQGSKEVSLVSQVSEPRQDKAFTGDTSKTQVALVSQEASPSETRQDKGCDTNGIDDISQGHLSLDFETPKAAPVVFPDQVPKQVSQVSQVSNPRQVNGSSGDTSGELVSLVSPQVSPNLSAQGSPPPSQNDGGKDPCSLSWDDPRLPHKYRLNSGIPWAKPLSADGPISPWEWEELWE